VYLSALKFAIADTERSKRDLEAKSDAYVVGQYYGLDTDGHCLDSDIITNNHVTCKFTHVTVFCIYFDIYFHFQNKNPVSSATTHRANTIILSANKDTYI